MSELSSIPIARLLARVAPLVRQGRLPQARRLLTRAWSAAADRLVQAPPSGGKFLALAADFEARHERPLRAASLSRQASRRFRRQDPDHGELPRDLDALAAALEALAAAETAPADAECHELDTWSLGEQADLLWNSGNVPAAREAAVRVVDAYRAHLPSGHPGLLPGLRRLAALSVDTGDWVAAEPLLQEMAEIYARNLGRDHLALARLRRELADVCVKLEDYGRAEELYEAAITALRQRTRATPAHLGRLLLALAHVHRSRGRPERAEATFHQAWKTAARALGRDHPLAARIANDLGTLYYELGWPSGARALYDHAARVLRQAPRRRFTALGGCLNNLALLALHSGAPESAAELFGEHLVLRRRALGDDDPGLTRALLHLAAAHQESGAASEAERCCRQAMTHVGVVLGERHPASAEAAVHLARTLAGARQWNEAEALLRQARRVRHRALGPWHPQLADVHCDLASICAATGRGRAALEELARAAAVDDGWLRRVPPALLTRRWSPLPSLRARLERILGLVGSHFGDDAGAAAWAFALTLRRKGLARDLRARLDALPASPSPGAQELARLETQIVRKWLAGPGTGDLALHRTLIASWIRRRRRLERELAGSGPSRAAPAFPKASACPIRSGRLGQSLGRDGALLELVRCGADHEGERYFGFLVTPRTPIRMLDLGNARLVESSVDEDRGRFLLEPLAPLLAGCRRLFVAPDGDELERLPFERLAFGGEAFLPPDCSVSLVWTGRDLLALDPG